MFTLHLSHLATTALGAAAIALAAAGTAGAAAGNVDDAFFAQVKAAGVQFGSPQAAVAEAHRVCAMLATGHNGSYATAKVLGQTPAYFSAQRAHYFVVVSTQTYCPEFAGQLN